MSVRLICKYIYFFFNLFPSCIGFLTTNEMDYKHYSMLRQKLAVWLPGFLNIIRSVHWSNSEQSNCDWFTERGSSKLLASCYVTYFRHEIFAIFQLCRKIVFINCVCIQRVQKRDCFFFSYVFFKHVSVLMIYKCGNSITMKTILLIIQNKPQVLYRCSQRKIAQCC